MESRPEVAAGEAWDETRDEPVAAGDPVTPAASVAPARTVTRALADVAAIGPYFTIAVADSAEGWRPAAELYPTGMAELVAATATALRTDEVRVAASTVQLGYAARLWSTVLACATLHQVVPDLTGLCHNRTDATPLRLPDPRGWLVHDPGRLGALTYRVVVTDHLEPLTAGLRDKVAAGLLWGNAGSALLGAARVLVGSRPESAGRVGALVDRLLATDRLRGTGHVTGPGMRFQRLTCCLYYRVPGGGTCADCSLLS